MRPNKPAVAIAAATALMALAACGGGGGGGTTGPTQTAQEGGGAGAGVDPEATAPAPEPEGADQAQDGGILTVDTAVAPTTLDPTRAYYTDSTAIMSDLVTRSLTQYVWRPSEDGSGQGEMVLIPDMATDLGQPNDDNTEWTFTLREGLKYEDGTPVQAEDVAYAIKRSFAIEELPDGPTYQTTFFLDGDKYVGPYKDQSELKGDQYSGTDYKGVEVSGQDITIKMRRPFVDMAYYASFPAFTAIPEAADTNPDAYGKNPLATGPYKFEAYKPGQSLTLTRNTNWDPATDPGRHQYVDGWQFNFAQNTDKIEGTLVNDTGEAQTSLTYDNVTAPTYKKILDAGEEDRLTQGTSPCTFMWYMDQTKITDKNVRMALGYAYPYQAAAKALGEVIGVTRILGSTVLPPGTNGRVEYDVLGNGGSETDPAKSKELLAAAGAEGYEIKFYFLTDDPYSVAAKEEIVKGLEAGGFKATPIASTSTTIRDDRTQYDAPVNIRSSGWCSDWPSGGSWFPAQWAGELVGLEGMPNPSNLDDPAINDEINNILDNATFEEAPALWGQLDEQMETDIYPAVVIGYSGTATLAGSRVGGSENDSVRGIPTFGQMFIVSE